MKCLNCNSENPSNARTCSVCGAALVKLDAEPIPGEVPGDDTVATIIPYKNPSALIAYYIGLFSCCPVPILGLVMGIVSIVLAFKGFKAARLNPSAHGKAHAWIGLICGIIGVMIGLIVVLAVVAGIISSYQKK